MSKTIGVVLALKDQFTSPAKKATASTRALNQELKRTKVSVKNFGLSVAKYSKMGALAVAGLGVTSLKMGAEFSKSIAKVSTIADTNVVSMKDMRKEIINLSNSTGASANALSEDVYNAISAGVDTANAVNTVAVNTKLAKAGFAETSDTLDLLTTIVNGYGKSIKEADKIGDILITTQNKGKVTVGELSASMGKIIPTANAMNVQFEQVASGYAIMTANGIKSAEATTYMNSMINELGKSGTKASKSLEKSTGKTFNQLMKEGMSIGDVLAILESEAKKSNVSLMDMFGSAEAGKSALVLAKNGGKDFNAMMKEMQNSTGATQTAFDKLDQEPIEKFNKALNRAKNKGIELGVALLPTASKILDGLLKITEIPLEPYFTAIYESGKKVYDFFNQNWNTIAPIIMTIVGAMVAYKAVTIAQATYTKALALAEGIKTGVLATGATTVNAVTIAQWALNTAMLANPIAWVIAGIAALIAIIILIVKNFDDIKLKLAEVWAKLEPFRTAVELYFTPLITAVKLLWETFKGFFKTLGKVVDKLMFWKKEKKDADNLPESVETDESYGNDMQKFAKGGIARKPSIFGEAGAEIAIPLKKNSRSRNLLAVANKIINGDKEKPVQSITGSNTSTSQVTKSDTEIIYQIFVQGNIYGEEDLINKVGSAIVKRVKNKMPVVV